MLLKAIVVEVIDQYSLRVRIPRYDKINTAFLPTDDKDLSIAPICSPPGIIPIYNPGDIVIVGFENDLQNMPIVLGQLFCEKNSGSSTSMRCDSLEVTVDAQLTSDIKIGDVEYSELKMLQGATDNIQYQIDALKESV